ncbi:MAG TPA: oligosaccharide flippase family protein [Oligoflexia bacterium]|nr:oligosaccharide flippase family protein [Oligoflexia bacterium]
MKRNFLAWSLHTFWTLAEHASTRILDAIVTIVLIRIFSTEQFGLFSIYQSWTGIALLFLPSLELALYRDYNRLKNQGSLARELSVYRQFNYIKMFVALMFAFAISLIPNDMNWTVRFAIVIFAFALPLSQAFYGFLREILRFELRTKWVALIGAVQRLVLIGAIIGVARLRPGDASAISGTAILIYVLFGWVWGVPLRGAFKVSKENFGKYLQRMKAILSSTVLWIHLNGVMAQFIQTLDTFFLGNLGVALETVGVYSITLKSANFFQVLPVALVNPFGVYLGRNAGNASFLEEAKLLKKMILGFVTLCGSLYLFGHFFALEILNAVGRGKISVENVDLALTLFRWQLAGVLLLCVTHPLTTYIGARCSLKAISKEIFLPWLIVAAIIYGVAAKFGGALWSAYANVPTYLILVVLLGRFYRRQVTGEPTSPFQGKPGLM